MTTRALGKQLAEEYTAAAWYNHTPSDVESFFAGLELVGPGVTEAQTWRAWMPQPVMRHRDGHVLAGVAQRQALLPARQPGEPTADRHGAEAGELAASRTMILQAAHLTDVEY